MFANSIKRSAAVFMYAVAIFASSGAKADLVKFDVAWGDADGGSAAASATFTMWTNHIPAYNPAANPDTPFHFITMDEVQSLVVTVTGAGAGNGTFGKSDFTAMDFSFTGVLTSYNGELLGQGFTPGTGAFGGEQSDFNLFTDKEGTVGGPAVAPSGNALSEMLTNGDGVLVPGVAPPEQHELIVDSIIATTLVHVVPEPDTYAMLLAGLGLAGFMARRKR
jgi:hypothetical protein